MKTTRATKKSRLYPVFYLSCGFHNNKVLRAGKKCLQKKAAEAFCFLILISEITIVLCILERTFANENGQKIWKNSPLNHANNGKNSIGQMHERQQKKKQLCRE